MDVVETVNLLMSKEGQFIALHQVASVLYFEADDVFQVLCYEQTWMAKF